jgi:hypothetical protein
MCRNPAWTKSTIASASVALACQLHRRSDTSNKISVTKMDGSEVAPGRFHIRSLLRNPI